MNGVHLYFRDRDSWHTFGLTHVRGYAYLGGRLHASVDLSKVFATQRTVSEFSSVLKRLNGFYAIVHQTDGRLFLAVDRLRSIPLFYSAKEEEIYVSDDAHWVRDQLGDEAFGELASTEFCLTGYVTGNDTLFASVKQLQLGEMLVIEQTHRGARVTPERYHRYIHRDYIDGPQEELIAELDAVLLNVFERLIRWARGRSIIVPLSSGYDSRLIVLMLKRLKYENVIAFSYGRPGNEEAKVSRQVAQGLGTTWRFVPYSHEAWYRWFQADARKAYYRMADGLGSVPHIQDWPAVWEMMNLGAIPQDSVFVPGHSADLLAGSRSRTLGAVYKLKEFCAETFVQGIMNYHYSLWDWSSQRGKLYPVFRERILSSLGGGHIQFPDTASAFESWDVQERQAKFIVNSVRVYEFWGYEWWLPFWDVQFMDFWSRVPLEYRVGERLYRAYAERLRRKITGTGEMKADRMYWSSVVSAAKSTVRKTPLYGFLKRHTEYDNHPLAWYGIVPRKLFGKLYTGHQSINSFLALERLKRISFSISE